MHKFYYIYHKAYFKIIGDKCKFCHKGYFLEDINWKSDWHCWRKCSKCGKVIKAFFPKGEEDDE